MRKLAGITIAGLLLLSACTGNDNPSSQGSPGPDASGNIRPTLTNAPPTVHAASLERFDACPELLTHLRTEGKKRVGPYGIGGAGGFAIADMGAPTTAMAEEGAAQRSSADSSAGAAKAAAPPAFSGTNVQEANVDEPDSIKTNGDHLFTLRSDERAPANQRLVAIDPNDGRPRGVGSVALPEAQNFQLLLAGDRMLALGQPGYQIYAERGMATDMMYPGPQASERTIIAVVDISDPEDMEVTDIVRLEGTYASARLIDGIARIVLNTTQIGPELKQPAEPSTKAQKDALEENKRIIDGADIKEWLPRFKVTDAKGEKRSEGPLASCATTYHPRTFSGFGNVSVVTIDPADPDPRNSASVLGSAGTVYASEDNLYVATQKWPEPQPVVIDDVDPNGGPDTAVSKAPEIAPVTASTALHRFDIRDPKGAVYAASGEIEGTVLNQWSLSENDGHLRVATTLDTFNRENSTSTNSVTVLDATRPKLNKVGEIGGLGKNERIYGVRFIGDLGYVVTFRQIDPLHVIDFSDPTQPELLGELKIPGYSAYLHPIGDTLLLGVGRDITEDGQPLGTQLSLFDVSDPSKPERIDTETIGSKDSYTPVEQDHHAFLWWDPTSLAMVPVDSYDPQTGAYRGGAYGFRIADRKITEVGSITHSGHLADKNFSASVSRSIVIGDDIFTLSMAGLMGSELDSLDELGFSPFAPYGR